MNKLSTPSFLIDLMTARQRKTFYFLVALWLISIIIFFKWWFDYSHVIAWSRFVLNSFLIGWTIIIPGYYFYFVSRMKRPNPIISIPRNWRIAMVVTKAPSEPFSVVRKTLLAMKAQKFSHDTWLADEDPTAEITEWCNNNEVFISTRRGNLDYQRDIWPRRKKCKEGNLAYFYDHYGYEKYDFVVQMDADHVPEAGYLEAMLRPFVDSRVGYVSAPSICDANASHSWVARARLYAEATLHGSLQAGYSDGWAPLCIGSHYAVRTKALKEIGGLGPELAEDHSTTLLFNASNWKGVHSIDAIARGDGPATFADAMTQELQWSRSLVTLLLTLTPKLLNKLSLKRKIEFLFSQLWYPVFALVMLLAFFLPIEAIFSGKPWVNIDYVEYLVFSFFPTFTASFVVIWIRRKEWFRPSNAPVFSWEAAFFQIARWPWVLWGTILAFISFFKENQAEFRVTPKGVKSSILIPFRVILPYVILSCSASFPVLLGTKSQSSFGYYYFALTNTLLYLLLIISIIYKHFDENRT